MVPIGKYHMMERKRLSNGGVPAAVISVNLLYFNKIGWQKDFLQIVVNGFRKDR